MTTFIYRLVDLLDIHTGEGALVTMLFLHSFFIGITRTFTDAAASALFLSQFDAQDLPYMYMGISVVVVLTGLLYAELGKRLPLPRLLTLNLGFIFVVLCAARLSFALTDSRLPAFALAIGFEVIWVLTSLEFWSLAGRIFDVRQGKRLFGLIGTGGVAATILSGAFIPLLVAQVGTPNLLLAGAGGVLLSMGTMRYIVNKYLRNGQQPTAAAGDSPKLRASRLLRNRYIQLIFLLAAFAMVARYFVDNAYLYEVRAEIPDREQLASFFGVFLSVSGVLTLLSRVFIAGPVMSRFGVIAGLLLLPMLLILGAGATMMADAMIGSVSLVFWLVAATKMCDKVLRYSVNRASMQVLYQPLPVEQRLWVQTTTESVVEALAGGIAGVTLLVLHSALSFGTIQILWGLLGVLVGWVVVVVLLNQQYVAVLVKALSRRQLEGIALTLEDNASIAVLKRGLSSPHPGEVIYALNMLEESGQANLGEMLPALLAHPVPEVRLHALERIESEHIVSALPTVKQVVDADPVPHVRGQALRAWSGLAGGAVYNEILSYLTDSIPAVSKGAMVALLRDGGVEGGTPAGKLLVTWLNARDAQKRELAAQVLGEIGYHNLYPQLGRLLRDESPRVRRAALTAAGHLQRPELWDAVIENLASPYISGDAVAVLTKAGSATESHLTRAFEQHINQRDFLIRLARVCGKIGGEAMIALLKGKINFPDPDVRWQILNALRMCDFRANGEESALIYDQITREVQKAAQMLASLSDIQPDEMTAMLRAALLYEIEQTRWRLFALLSFIYNPDSINRARDNIAHNAAEKRAYALEILDMVVAQELNRLIFPLIEQTDTRAQLEALAVFFPQERLDQAERVRVLVADATNHYWTQTCALYTAAKSGDIQYVEPVMTALKTTDPLIKETALWALHQLSHGLYILYTRNLDQAEKTPLAQSITQINRGMREGKRLLLTVEKVIILKTVSIFADTADDLLAKIATIIEEEDIEAGQTIIEKGMMGNCMYIIAYGKVRVHDGERSIAELGEREVVGELSLLDSEPRNASVTALEDTLLLRLDQEAFFELVADHSEVGRGIIRVLTRRLRRTSAG